MKKPMNYDKRSYNESFNSRYASKIPIIILIICALLTVPPLIDIGAHAAEPGSTGDPIALKSYVDSKITELDRKLTAMIAGAGQAQGAAQGAASGANANAGGAAAGSGAAGDVAALTARIASLEKSLEKLSEENSRLAAAVQQLPTAAQQLTDKAGQQPSAAAAQQYPADAGVNSGNALAFPGSAASADAADRFISIQILANQRIVMGASTEMVLRTGKALAVRGEYGAIIDLIAGKDLDAGENIPQNHLLLSPRKDNRGVKIVEDAWLLIKGPYELR